jgi:hypothetical protein
LKRKDKMKTTSLFFTFSFLLLLAGCGGITAGGGGQGGSAFDHADRDGDAALNYEEFRHHANISAKREGADAMNRRSAEQMGGNRELHRRFIFLDRNNDGRVSESEMGGY